VKAFTIWQPWASLIMVGAKPDEFRPKSYLEYIAAPRVGDTIAIHAGARKIKLPEVHDLLTRLGRDDDRTALVPALALPLLERILNAPIGQPVVPLMHLLGTAVIGEPQLACDRFKMQVADSDRGAFDWAWPLSDIRPFVRPIEMRGAQGFWDVSDGVVSEALAA
jgi:hypothetical protein